MAHFHDSERRNDVIGGRRDHAICKTNNQARAKRTEEFRRVMQGIVASHHHHHIHVVILNSLTVDRLTCLSLSIVDDPNILERYYLSKFNWQHNQQKKQQTNKQPGALPLPYFLLLIRDFDSFVFTCVSTSCRRQTRLCTSDNQTTSNLLAQLSVSQSVCAVTLVLES